MEFISIPTEQTTAITDAIMGVLAVACIYYIGMFKERNVYKTGIWQWVFVFLAVSAFIGAIAHGFEMSKATNELLWKPITLFFGMMVALFVVGVIYDLKGETAARKFLPVMIVIGIIFFVIVQVLSGYIEHYFIVFIAYEAVAMLFSLSAYAWLYLAKKKTGTGWMTLGILLTIIGAVLQASGAIHFTLIWEFDHNSVYHFVQMVAVLFLVKGIKKSVYAGKVT